MKREMEFDSSLGPDIFARSTSSNVVPLSKGARSQIVNVEAGWAGQTAKAAPSLTVVIPAYNAEATLPDCLAALSRSVCKPDSIIVFDDGSTDQTAAIARASGAQVLSSHRAKQGPAIGRNIGAAAATDADIVVFVDADVVVAPEAIGRLIEQIVAGKADACFGSYDDQPNSRRMAALYANLRHHWVHQHGRTEAFTFWSGLGAVRRDVFQAHSGFDPRFRQPCIEDVEFGTRIVAGGGRIQLVKDAFGTHYKDWGLRQLWRTDVFQRAAPWARLIRQGRARANDLNIAIRERESAVAAFLVIPALLSMLINPALGLAALLIIGIYVVLNLSFFMFLFRTAGLRAGIAGTFLHWCYHLYASTTFVLVVSGVCDLFARSTGGEGSRLPMPAEATQPDPDSGR